MRLRRFELVIISVTLAFACFVGGYFVGRIGGSVSISPTVLQQNDIQAPAPQMHMVGVQNTPAVAVPAPTPAPEIVITDSANIPVAEHPPIAVPEQVVPSPQRSSRDAQGRININIASRSELTDLPGIGSSLSERIVAYREANGPFQRIEDLRNVSGIGERRFEAIMDKVTVGN